MSCVLLCLCLFSVCRPCETGWVNGNSSCSVIVEDVDEGKTWAEAREDCRGRRADLVVIDNEEEQVNILLAGEQSEGLISQNIIMSKIHLNSQWNYFHSTVKSFNACISMVTRISSLITAPVLRVILRATGWACQTWLGMGHGAG